MPCRDWEHVDNQSAASARDDLRIAEQENEKLRVRNDFLARMLCWSCKTIEGMRENCVCDYGNEHAQLPPDLLSWWNEHKILDEKRKQEMKERALAKLTDEEKEALGLIK